MTDTLPALNGLSKKEQQKRKLFSELYVALKIASDLSSRVSFSTYYSHKIKDGEDLKDYEVESLMKDLLLAESAIDATRKAFGVAKDHLNRVMTAKLFEQFVEEDA